MTLLSYSCMAGLLFKVAEVFKKEEIFTTEYINLLVPIYCLLDIFLLNQ